MRVIKDLCDSIRENIDEAHDHICTAYDLIDTNRQAADWYRDMASSHLGFNTAGHMAVKKLIDERKSGPASELLPGMLAVYEAVHSDLIKRSA